MKKVFLIILLGLILVGCGKEKNRIPNAAASEAKEPETAEPEEPTAAEDKEEGKVVTDEVIIDSMAEEILNQMTIEEKIGQMFLVNLEGLDNSQGNYYEHRAFTKRMQRSLKKYGVGGVILFSRNIETRNQTIKLIQKLQNHSKVPLWVAVDEEGGDVARIANNENMGTTKFPSMWEVGANENEDYAYDMGSTIANDISALGFNLDFAPVADVKTNETNTEIGNRSFGDDADKVASMVCAVVKGLQDNGVSAALKHFPGDGDVEGDTHFSSVNIDNDLNRLRNVDFVPFKEGIKAGVDFVMVSHISISRVAGNTTPASLSNLVMKTILRNELEFKGLIITDAMDMKAITNHYSAAEAAVRSVKAGADIVLEPADFQDAYNGVYNAYINGKITEDRINDSVLRNLKMKIKRGIILSNSDLIPEDSSLTYK